ncbi:hypothetical protein PGB90_005193 [Kerria lacca]
MYSVGSAFFISLAGIWGYVLLPLLTGSYHDHVMNVLVGLSFGSLITSAICQLIPEAYELTSVSAKYIYIAIFSMVGLWLTALIQSLSTILGKENSKEKIQLDVFNSLGNPNHVHESSNLEGRSFHNFSSENDTENPFIHEIKKLNSENEFRNHSFCRRSSYASIKKKPKLSKLAIIILAGDCMNNFMDGISIGAGYSYQLSTGIKLSAAIAFEEYTHKLGDFAIVFQSGISMKRVLFWNYSTSCACFFGVAIGVALGNLHWSQYIFSFASGLFLYIALSNMQNYMRKIKKCRMLNVVRTILEGGQDPSEVCVTFAWQSQNVHLNHTVSDEMCSSSTSKDKDCSTFYQSDSDDICSGVPSNISYNLMNMSTICRSIPNNMESDSLNENSPCRRSARRKRKFKRITMDVDISSNRFHPPSFMLHHNKKKRIMRHSPNCPGGRLWLNSGKRKRSFREKLGPQLGSNNESPDLGREAKVLGISKLSLNDYPEDQYNAMEVSYTVPGISSSSLSSSGSETGIFTNDEGREGDDEQSDWIGDVSLVAGGLNFHNKKNQVIKSEGTCFTYEKFLVNDVQPSSSDGKKTLKLFLPQGNNCFTRVTRKKGYPVKSNFSPLITSESKTAKPIPEFVDHDFGKKVDVDIETKIIARRHTFSGYKRRKRIPTTQTSVVTDTISEKSPQIFHEAIQKLSDISSSDSKDSVH